MNEKRKRLKKQINKLTENLNTMLEYIWAFEVMPPRGDGAKQQCIEEWMCVTNKVLNNIRTIRQQQIELIEEE